MKTNIQIYTFLLLTTLLALSTPGMALTVVGAGQTDICTPDWQDNGGQESLVNPNLREVRARADGAAFQTHNSFAEVGMRFVTVAPTTASVNFSGILYQARLQGFGGINEARLRIRAIVRDLDSGDELANELVVEESENGSFGQSIINLVDNNFNPAATSIEVDLEAGREYAAILRLEARANGAGGNADILGGNRRATMACLEIATDISDQDGDGLLDDWETNGIDTDGDGTPDLLLQNMGADPLHKDIFVEFDWMPGQAPTRAAIQAMKEAFTAAPIDAGGIPNPDGQPGINLWVDTGNLTDAQASEDGAGVGSCGDGIDNGGDGPMDANDPDCLVGDNLGGGNLIPLADVPNGIDIPKLGGDADDNGISDFYEVKAIHFAANRALAFHYGISGRPKSNEDGAGAGSCSDGIDNGMDGVTDSADILDCFAGGQAELGGNDFIDFNHDPATIMHELGHNLNLGHGGDEGDNCKPNYVSVMNYDHQPAAIFVNGGPGNGQDLDGDGVADGRIVDFSPPRFAGGRGSAPLPSLDEEHLDETQALDPSDPSNQFVFKDGSGAMVRSPLDQPTDWDGSGIADNTDVQVNVDTSGLNGRPTACTNGDADDIHSGHDDWRNIVLAFLQFGDNQDAPRNPVEEPEPTLQDGLLIDRELNTADLRLEKHAPQRVMAGQAFDYRLTVSNLGPNPASRVRLTDLLPGEVSYVNDNAGCVEGPAGTLTCDLGEILARQSLEVRIRVRVPADLACRDAQFTHVSNQANVINLAGPDPDTSNNLATVRTQVLCRSVEYAAKLVCGTQPDADDLLLARGLYATTVNIHNPNDEEVFLFKKLALTYPPSAQRPGKIYPIGIDKLAYDEALKTDCNDLRDKVFGGQFPAPYIEGFVVLQGARSLDVVSVYSTAALSDEGKVSAHSGIHVETVKERRFERREEQPPRTDLVPLPGLPTGGIEGQPGGFHCVQNPQGGAARTVRVVVRNNGTAAAPASLTRVAFDGAGQTDQATPALAVGAQTTLDFDIPRGCYGPGSGRCSFVFSVDAQDAVAETDEGNNTLDSFCLQPAG